MPAPQNIAIFLFLSLDASSSIIFLIAMLGFSVVTIFQLDYCHASKTFSNRIRSVFISGKNLLARYFNILIIVELCLPAKKASIFFLSLSVRIYDLMLKSLFKITLAAFLSNGSFSFPHLGEKIHEGQPSLHSQFSINR